MLPSQFGVLSFCFLTLVELHMPLVSRKLCSLQWDHSKPKCLVVSISWSGWLISARQWELVTYSHEPACSLWVGTISKIAEVFSRVCLDVLVGCPGTSPLSGGICPFLDSEWSLLPVFAQVQLSVECYVCLGLSARCPFGRPHCPTLPTGLPAILFLWLNLARLKMKFFCAFKSHQTSP